MYRDPDAKTAERFGSSQYPETYIANKAGRVLFRVQGAMAWDDPEVRQRIEQLLAS
jgi:adenosyl cobinamide kinase/adenosyl cobinamide phosphate guanylyltransferase